MEFSTGFFAVCNDFKSFSYRNFGPDMKKQTKKIKSHHCIIDTLLVPLRIRKIIPLLIMVQKCKHLLQKMAEKFVLIFKYYSLIICRLLYVYKRLK